MCLSYSIFSPQMEAIVFIILQIFFATRTVLKIGEYLTIRPITRKGYESIAHEVRKDEWAIDPWPLRAKGLIVLVSPNQSDRKGNNKVSKCKLKKYLFGEKRKKSREFRQSMTIAIRPLVAQTIKMQDLHQSTSWVILIYRFRPA